MRARTPCASSTARTAASRPYGRPSATLYAPGGQPAAARQASARFSTAVRLSATSGPGSRRVPARTRDSSRGSSVVSPGPYTARGRTTTAPAASARASPAAFVRP